MARKPNYSHSSTPIEIQAVYQFQIPIPNGWNNNLTTGQKCRLIQPYIQHIIQNQQNYPQYIGYKTWIEYYNHYEYNEYRYGADCDEEHHRERWIDCLVGNQQIKYPI